ncbi:MAG: efflux RND transporter periplasmic adaptor subunit [Bacteroidetes bacterium]|nr:efflux RND transporter periplasmic adaptor subunit [Bacteroidota bacterium]
MKKIRIYGIIAVIIAAVFFALRLSDSSDSSEARRRMTPLVKVEKPGRELVKTQLQFNGDALAIRQAGIFSKVAGNLERIYADMGSRVYAGQLLATIDSTELYQQYQQTNATYQNNRISYERTMQLIEKGLSSKQELDNAEAAMKVALAGFEAAATRLSYARIVAPFTGIITKRFLDPGALVTANNATLFTLMNLDRVKIIVNVSEKDVPSVYRVNTAQATFDALPKKIFYGKVTRFSDALDLTTRTMAVQIEIENADHVIKPGMFATVQMTVAEKKNAVTVPTNALLKDNDGQYVFILNGDKAKQIRIKAGTELAERTEIISGLTGDEYVIVVGQQYVKDESAVNVQN